MAQQARQPPEFARPPATQKPKPPTPPPRIRLHPIPPATQKPKPPTPPPRVRLHPIPPATEKPKPPTPAPRIRLHPIPAATEKPKPPTPPPRIRLHPIPPATQKEKPPPPPRTSSLPASQATFPEASQEYDTLQRPRRPHPPAPSCEVIPEGPTQPLLPPRGQPDERSRRSLSEYLPPPPADRLEVHPPPAPSERPPVPPPDTDKQEAIVKKPFSRRKERKELGLVGNLTIDVPVAPDPYFKTESVMSLNVFNFDDFIKKHEKTLIMFFHSRKKESFFPSREFANASMRSSNKNHVFAAVDCSVDTELCCRENAKQLPTVKLYSNGFPLSSMSVVENFTADQMNMLMTMTPVLTQPREQFIKNK